MFDPGIEEGIADGPDQVRAAVRYQIKYGADVIKTCATGGVLSEGTAVGATQYTYEELKALVDEANKLERRLPRTLMVPRGSRSLRVPASRRSSMVHFSMKRARG